jgi:D-3-phosphoglycerate dehydrogenase
MNKTILFSTSSFDLEIPECSVLRAAGFNLVKNPLGRRMSEQEACEFLSADVIGVVAGLEPLSKKVLDAAKALKIISRCGVGLDNVDIKAANDLGVLVFNTPDAPSRPVAELALAHMLNLLRGISKADRQIRSGSWGPFMGSLLEKKVVGIIGFGRIGRRVAELVNAFGAEIIVFDIFDFDLPSYCSKRSIDQLMRESDLVSLHLPYSPENHHIINANKLALMKPSAYILNISRGGLIDESALFDALKDEKIAGAGIDAYEAEPYKGPLIELENVLMTAHMGSYAVESRGIMEKEAVNNLIQGLSKIGLIGIDK